MGLAKWQDSMGQKVSLLILVAIFMFQIHSEE